MSNYNSRDLGDTIVALSTPQGSGAIGVIRMSGTDAIHICNEVFKGKNLLKQKTQSISLMYFIFKMVSQLQVFLIMKGQILILICT